MSFLSDTLILEYLRNSLKSTVKLDLQGNTHQVLLSSLFGQRTQLSHLHCFQGILSISCSMHMQDHIPHKVVMYIRSRSNKEHLDHNRDGISILHHRKEHSKCQEYRSYIPQLLEHNNILHLGNLHPYHSHNLRIRLLLLGMCHDNILSHRSIQNFLSMYSLHLVLDISWLMDNRCSHL